VLRKSGGCPSQCVQLWHTCNAIRISQSSLTIHEWSCRQAPYRICKICHVVSATLTELTKKSARLKQPAPQPLRFPAAPRIQLRHHWRLLSSLACCPHHSHASLLLGHLSHRDSLMESDLHCHLRVHPLCTQLQKGRAVGAEPGNVHKCAGTPQKRSLRRSL